MNIENYNKLEWIKLAHVIIHNSKNYQNTTKLLEIKQNRNGIVINIGKVNMGIKLVTI